MFARMGGRHYPAAASPSGPPANWPTYEEDKKRNGRQPWWPEYERMRRADPNGPWEEGGATTGFTPLDEIAGGIYDQARERVEGRYGEVGARIMDLAATALALIGLKAGATRALATGAPREKAAVGNLFASLGSGLSAEAVAEYRRTHPTMHPVADRALAKVEALLQTVSALTGLRSAKSAAGGAAWRYAPKATAATQAKLAQAGSAVMRALGAFAAKLPKSVRTGGAWLNKAYQAIAGITGNELPALTGGVRQAAQQFAAGSFREGFKSLVAPAIVTAGLAGVEGYEQSQIDRYKREIRAAWDRGETYELPPDADPVTGPASALAAFAVGTLGNPVEKQTRNYFGGRYTKDLADLATYQVAYERIEAAQARGDLSPTEAEDAKVKLADTKKPWNMAGRSLYSFTPATAGLIKYQASKIADWLNSDFDYARIASDPSLPGVAERDADTIELEDGRKVRYLGIDATEIAHKTKPGSKDEPFAREATARAREIAPDGSVVRLRAGGAEGVDIDKYGRELRYVEAIPELVAAIPGLRRIWPGTDVGTALLEEGLAQPRYGELGAQNSRKRDYDAATATAAAEARGVWSPEGLESVDYHYKLPDAKPGEGLNAIGNLAGTGLLTTGQSGIFRALGPAGNLAAQAWNAAMSAIGTAQHVKAGNANRGKKYPALKALFTP